MKLKFIFFILLNIMLVLVNNFILFSQEPEGVSESEEPTIEEEAVWGTEGQKGAYSLSEERYSLYGYLVNFANINLYMRGNKITASDFGNILYLRLKGDWKPEENLSMHIEATYESQIGNQNTYVMMEYIKVIPSGMQDLYPLENFYETFSIDHIWANFSLWRLDMQFGKIPMAWGTGYVFNPTAKASALPFLDTVTEETPGTYGMVPSFSITEELERPIKRPCMLKMEHGGIFPMVLSCTGLLVLMIFQPAG